MVAQMNSPPGRGIARGLWLLPCRSACTRGGINSSTRAELPLSL